MNAATSAFPKAEEFGQLFARIVIDIVLMHETPAMLLTLKSSYIASNFRIVGKAVEEELDF